jgi:hypothetical protein
MRPSPPVSAEDTTAISCSSSSSRSERSVRPRKMPSSATIVRPKNSTSGTATDTISTRRIDGAGRMRR